MKLTEDKLSIFINDLSMVYSDLQFIWFQPTSTKQSDEFSKFSKLDSSEASKIKQKLG